MQLDFILIVIFILGLLVGSFLNVVIYWLETGLDKRQVTSDKRQIRKNLKGRSFCPSCGHQLKALDLIPIFSWLFLKGKCRYCKKKISLQYPLLELMTGFVFLLTFLFLSQEIFFVTSHWSLVIGLLKLIILLTLNSMLLTIFVYDLKHKIIPDKVMFPAIVSALCYSLLVITGDQNYNLSSFLFPFLSALGAGGFFYALAAVSDGKWMGGGDIKLAFFMGLLLGWPNILVGLFLGFLTGALFGLALIFSKKAKIQSEIPFGPFLILGTWIALFWGEKVIQWYLRTLGF